MNRDKFEKLKASLHQGLQSTKEDNIRRKLIARITDLTSGLDDREISQMADKLFDDYMEFLNNEQQD